MPSCFKLTPGLDEDVIARSPAAAADASSLSDMLSLLHVKTAEWVNKLDQSPSRQVWFNFRETKLTHQRSYLARLNYVHQNAVKHGLVPVACQYPWCSAAWFERMASAAMVKSIYRFKTDRISVADEFEVSADWQAGKSARGLAQSKTLARVCVTCTVIFR